MVQKNSIKKVVAIVGATGVGKTSISIKIAKKYGFDIINCDQSQMRKHLNIGTAKIKKEEMSSVKHHLIDFLEPLKPYSIKDFQTDGRMIINNSDKICLIVGGSGLYIDALLSNYVLDSVKRCDDEKYSSLTNDELYDLLYSMNQEAALKTHPNNRKRVLRYIEIIEDNKTIDNPNKDLIYDALIIFLNNDRDKLYDNINKRCDEMFNNGWIEEVKGLIDSGYDASLIKEIGYKEINDYIKNNNHDLELLKEEIKKQTRHYAKRQITWFKNKMQAIEIKNDSNAFNSICLLIDSFIGGNNEN